MLVFWEEGKLNNLEKNPQSKARTIKKLSQLMAPGRNQTQATLVGGECFHHWQCHPCSYAMQCNTIQYKAFYWFSLRAFHHFSWENNCPRELKNNAFAEFWGKTKCTMGNAYIVCNPYKTCFVGRIGAGPDPLPSGILPIDTISWVNISQVSLVSRKWLLNSSGKIYSSIVLWTCTCHFNFLAYNN